MEAFLTKNWDTLISENDGQLDMDFDDLESAKANVRDRVMAMSMEGGESENKEEKVESIVVLDEGEKNVRKGRRVKKVKEESDGEVEKE
jgi:hypothetical protein